MQSECTAVPLRSCTRCRHSKPLDEFSPSKRWSDGLAKHCQRCTERLRAKRRRYLERHHESHLERRRAYYRRTHEQDPSGTIERWRAWHLANPTANKDSHRRQRIRLREAALDAYGRSCGCCGECVPSMLTIDHINGDGAAHRKTITDRFYRWLLNNGYPEGYRTLCWNCNVASYRNGGICPHTEVVTESA
jgi:hypothetical protein